MQNLAIQPLHSDYGVEIYNYSKLKILHSKEYSYTELFFQVLNNKSREKLKVLDRWETALLPLRRLTTSVDTLGKHTPMPPQNPKGLPEKDERNLMVY